MEETILSRLRDWMNTGPGRWAAVGVILVLVAAAAAVFLRDSTEADADAIRAKGRKILYYCTSCKETGEARIGWGDEFPLSCPHCGKRTAVTAFRCVKCRNVIQKKDDLVYPCPRCGFVYDKRIAPEYPLQPSSGP